MINWSWRRRRASRRGAPGLVVTGPGRRPMGRGRCGLANSPRAPPELRLHAPTTCLLGVHHHGMAAYGSTPPTIHTAYSSTCIYAHVKGKTGQEKQKKKAAEPRARRYLQIYFRARHAVTLRPPRRPVVPHVMERRSQQVPGTGACSRAGTRAVCSCGLWFLAYVSAAWHVFLQPFPCADRVYFYSLQYRLFLQIKWWSYLYTMEEHAADGWSQLGFVLPPASRKAAIPAAPAASVSVWLPLVTWESSELLAKKEPEKDGVWYACLRSVCTHTCCIYF